MAKKNEGKYDVVDKLPKGAKLVKDYAQELGLSQPAIYNRYARGTADFKIVIYFERNFVVPN